MTSRFSCAIQVGGKSRRFGRDKTLLQVEGQPMAVRIVNRLRGVSDDVMLVGNRLERFDRIPARQVPDTILGMGVLGGIYTSIQEARNPYVFVCACDMPFVNPALVRFLASVAEGYDVVMPHPGGVPEPLHALYGKSALPAIERLIRLGDPCPLSLLSEVRLRLVDDNELQVVDPRLLSFFNVNKPQDWTAMQSILLPYLPPETAACSPMKEKDMYGVPVISVVGKSNVGKTTLIEKLLPELKRRGYRVATIKHDAHRFELDQPGKDTWRHAQAGSDCVVIASSEKLAIIETLDRELSLDEIVARLPAVDLVVTEGYKRQNKPKIEVSRREMGSQLLCDASELICLVTDQPFVIDVPQFGLDDVTGIADLIEKLYPRQAGRVS